MKSHLLFTIVSAAMLFSACSEEPKKAAEKAPPPPPPEPVSGSTAFFRMYTAARGWAADVQALGMNSINLPEVKREPGKAAAWQVMFVSPEKQRARPYTYSVIEAPGNLHKGVFAGNEEGWSGPRGPAQATGERARPRRPRRARSPRATARASRARAASPPCRSRRPDDPRACSARTARTRPAHRSM